MSETKFLFQKYASSLAEEESFEIVHADGEKIMLEMSNKISKVFDKNIAALKVRPLVVSVPSSSPPLHCKGHVEWVMDTNN